MHSLHYYSQSSLDDTCASCRRDGIFKVTRDNHVRTIFANSCNFVLVQQSLVSTRAPELATSSSPAQARVVVLSSALALILLPAHQIDTVHPNQKVHCRWHLCLCTLHCIHIYCQNRRSHGSSLYHTYAAGRLKVNTIE